MQLCWPSSFLSLPLANFKDLWQVLLLPTGGHRPWLHIELRLSCKKLADVATELLAYPDESAVDVAGSISHTSRGRQGNQGNNQQILDQSLATFVLVKGLQQSRHSCQFVTPLILELNDFIGSNRRFIPRLFSLITMWPHCAEWKDFRQ